MYTPPPPPPPPQANCLCLSSSAKNKFHNLDGDDETRPTVGWLHSSLIQECRPPDEHYERGSTLTRSPHVDLDDSVDQWNGSQLTLECLPCLIAEVKTGGSRGVSYFILLFLFFLPGRLILLMPLKSIHPAVSILTH